MVKQIKDLFLFSPLFGSFLPNRQKKIDHLCTSHITYAITFTFYANPVS